MVCSVITASTKIYLTDAIILLPHNTWHDRKQKTYHNGQRIVSGSNAFVLRLPKNQCFWKIYNDTDLKKITQFHTTEIAVPRLCDHYLI